jgi:predicted amidophosphoribosyltransferase
VARCSECRGRRLAFARARAAVAYEGPAVAFVHAWKDGGCRGAARLAAAFVSGALERPPADAIAFVPAARDRELWRGHNPARGLATHLADVWELPLVEAVRRVGGVRPQRGLAARERRRNVAGAFRVVRRSPACVVLVDDVYTSGSTVAATASALRAAGARRVEVVTFARTLRDRNAAVVDTSPSARLHPI